MRGASFTVSTTQTARHLPLQPATSFQLAAAASLSKCAAYALHVEGVRPTHHRLTLTNRRYPMKKIKLDLDQLEVESFDTTPTSVGRSRGTVYGFDEQTAVVGHTCGFPSALETECVECQTGAAACTQSDSCLGTCTPQCPTNESCPGTCFEVGCQSANCESVTCTNFTEPTDPCTGCASGDTTPCECV